MEEFSTIFELDRFEYYDIYKRLTRSGFVDEALFYSGQIEETGYHRREYESDYRISSIEENIDCFYTTEYFQGFYQMIT